MNYGTVTNQLPWILSRDMISIVCQMLSFMQVNRNRNNKNKWIHCTVFYELKFVVWLKSQIKVLEFLIDIEIRSLPHFSLHRSNTHSCTSHIYISEYKPKINIFMEMAKDMHWFMNEHIYNKSSCYENVFTPFIARKRNEEWSQWVTRERARWI